MHSSTYAFDLQICYRSHTVDFLDRVISHVLRSYQTGGKLINALRQLFSRVILRILRCTGRIITRNPSNSSSNNSG